MSKRYWWYVLVAWMLMLGNFWRGFSWTDLHWNELSWAGLVVIYEMLTGYVTYRRTYPSITLIWIWIWIWICNQECSIVIRRYLKNDESLVEMYNVLCRSASTNLNIVLIIPFWCSPSWLWCTTPSLNLVFIPVARRLSFLLQKCLNLTYHH